MDYEKKYNEAFEKARRLYEGKDKAPEEPILEYLFPELREGEDEKVRTLLVALVQWAKTFSQSGLDTSTANKMLSYLEKQKEQKPAEWSEKDEKMREKLINFLGSPHVPLTYEEFSEYRSWLISLRPQPHWKPSEEQMKELKDASAVMKCDSDDSAFPLLKTLYEQLQKL